MKNSLLFLSLMITVVVIPNQLLICDKLLSQPSDQRILQRQCKTPIQPEFFFPEEQGVAQEALVACDRALANTPKNSPILIDILANKAFALQILGRYEEAIAIWDRIISIDPQRGSNRANVVRDLQKYSRWNFNRPIQIPDTWAKALTEALRLSPFNSKQPNYPVYSDWKLTPKAIAVYSRLCTKKVVLPEEFANNPALARSIIECAVRVFLNEEYYQTKNNELEAARRAAAIFWFGTADSVIIDSPREAEFLQEVVNNYQKLRSASK
ncbi:tetratricopeptide repeat protein [[Phormidium ambiguum] IAM M-71]|uniref:tetratricopeptide repeat protein n=1 Tax=[Phormidium ambiguum] IAM M-71 TaxID=454136 RepID=UPI000A060ABA|nr:tetratricopeptide repeat protein [Phormidium ambiguum]